MGEHGAISIQGVPTRDIGPDEAGPLRGPVPTLAGLLTEHKDRRSIGDAKIATLASDRSGIDGYVTRSTVRNWATGSSASVNNWRQLALIASALQLDRSQADQLMVAGGCDPVSDLRRFARPEDEVFLRYWIDDDAPSMVDVSASITDDSIGESSSASDSVLDESCAATNSLTQAPLAEDSTAQVHIEELSVGDDWGAPAPQPITVQGMSPAQAPKWPPLLFALLGGLAAIGLWLLVTQSGSGAASVAGTRDGGTFTPVTTVELPAAGSTIGGNIIASGTASHVRGVEHVELVIKDLDESTYWNPVDGVWQSEFVRFAVAVDQQSPTVVWDYRLPVPVVSGNYRVRAWSRSLAGTGDPIGPMSEFTVSNPVALDLEPGTAADTTGSNPLIVAPPSDGFPVSTVDHPMPAEIVDQAVVVRGTATDPDGIAYVELVFRNLDTDEYWNPELDLWQSEFTRFAIAVDEADAVDATWRFQHPGPLIDGNYRARVWAHGTDGGRDEERILSDFVIASDS